MLKQVFSGEEGKEMEKSGEKPEQAFGNPVSSGCLIVSITLILKFNRYLEHSRQNEEV
ncbi:MAG: hypothetical protein KDD10_05620 [Phaeodactylibacter sp.]|nr:hypothetical protein [Phaeodactylibacter sp.]MCB9298805.1 hypothetical protein [Lewinellaceae bacterium]